MAAAIAPSMASDKAPSVASDKAPSVAAVIAQSVASDKAPSVTSDKALKTPAVAIEKVPGPPTEQSTPAPARKITSNMYQEPTTVISKRNFEVGKGVGNKGKSKSLTIQLIDDTEMKLIQFQKQLEDTV